MWLVRLAKRSRTVKRLIADKDLFSELREKYLLLDTCCLIHATKQPELVGKFIKELGDKGCTLVVTPAVKLEFLRGADSFDAIRAREKYFAFLKTVVYPIEKYLDKIPEFSVVIQKASGGNTIELSDYLLVASLVIHPEMYLLTENHRHMPMAILDRISVITWDNDKDIKNLGLYKLNGDKYESAVSDILKQK